MKIKNYLIIRIHDGTNLIPDFVPRPANHTRVPNQCEFDQLLSDISQNKKHYFV